MLNKFSSGCSKSTISGRVRVLVFGDLKYLSIVNIRELSALERPSKYFMPRTSIPSPLLKAQIWSSGSVWVLVFGGLKNNPISNFDNKGVYPVAGLGF